MKFGSVFSEEMLFKDISYLSSGSPLFSGLETFVQFW